MRTKIAAATFALIGAGATTIAALDPPINMQGSDTLFVMTKDVIANCEIAPPGNTAPLGITYVGSGSGNGQNNILRNCQGVVPTPPNTQQTVAPMSRFLTGSAVAGACGCTAAGGVPSAVAGANAEGIAVALDGVGLLVNGNNAPASCGGIAHTKLLTGITDVNGDGLQCPGCVNTNEYQAADAFDFLRVAWFGIHHNDPTGLTPNCSSDVRRSMLANYQNIFQAPCPAGVSACPTGIRHLWRRDDGSGTTDVFATLVGGGAAVGKFCNVNGGLTTGNGQVLGGTNKNGFDFQDNDPVRVACSGNGLTTGEQVCGDAGQGHLGTLGMLLTIFVPETIDVPPAEIYPVGICTPGVVASLPATKSTYTGPCPSGGPSFGGRCFASMFRNPDNTLNANCVQAFGTGRCPTLVPAGTDCRGANLWLRKPNGDIVIDTSLPASRTAPPVPPAGRLYLGAFYRIHTTTRQSNGTAVCATASATEQIGCLSSLASPCSMGFAGRAAGDIPPAALLTVGGVANDIVHIENLVTQGPYNVPPGSNLDTYPLARKLYVNTMVGFENVTGQELRLAQCYSNDALMAAPAGAGPFSATGATTPGNIIASNGFIRMPVDPTTGHRSRCESFAESACTGGGSNTNSCLNNPTGIPTN